MSIPSVFCPHTFGAALARKLDALYIMEAVWHAVDRPYKPFTGLFAKPDGTSYYEADELTCRYIRSPRELEIYLVEDIVPGARALFEWEVVSDAETIITSMRAELEAKYRKKRSH
jgi:hypothetical protein